jgi:tRNA modification GTPase
MLEDTIIAISTPVGIGGLGIVRLSGRKAVAIGRKIFRPRACRGGSLPIRRAVFGDVFDPWQKEAVDEGFLTYFRAPHSYTREDVVEFCCHGSPVVLEEVVRLGVQAGARPAHPGEFTLRAYVNGRLDIVQAEAVNDLIRSASLTQARISRQQLSGSLSRRILHLRKGLIHLIAQVEAGLEFPDEHLRTSPRRHAQALAGMISDLETLVESYEAGRAMREGITLAILGRTNVGKSTLFNALLEEDRAIVTPYPGTTRDYLREKLVIGGCVFHLVDMAGLGKPSHPVEEKGIRKGRKIARSADGLLIVLDGSRRVRDEDDLLIRTFQGKKAILVVNKADLPRKIDKKSVRALARGCPVIEVSALKGMNLKLLKAEIRRVFAPGGDFRGEIILHARQRDILVDILEAVKKALRALEGGRSEEICAEELRTAISLVGRLTGEIRADEVMADIFKRFCVGK